MRFAGRMAWRLAGMLSPITRTFTWEWAIWWQAALIRFASTGERVTVTRANGEPL
jgi:hypothetical protein